MSVIHSFTIFKEDDEFVATVARPGRDAIRTYRLRGDRPGRLVEMLIRSPRTINHRMQYRFGGDWLMAMREPSRTGVKEVYKHHFTLR